MKLMIVDGNSILTRAFYGVKPLSNHKGVFTNAIYGFFNILLRAADDTKAEQIVIAFDRREKTFWHQAVESYKANRKGRRLGSGRYPRHTFKNLCGCRRGLRAADR